MKLLPPICDFEKFDISRVPLLRQARLMLMAKLEQADPRKRPVGIRTKSAPKSKVTSAISHLDAKTQQAVLLALSKIRK